MQVEEIKQELDKYGLKPTEKVEVKDPLTGEKRMIAIDRTGNNESKLVVALADPNLSREKKDHALSMYLWERGAESSSLMVDLMRYKGQHSKQNQLFSSRMRLDFETFVNSFTGYLANQSRLIGLTLGVNIDEEKRAFENWLKLPGNSARGFTYRDFNNLGDRTHVALVEMAIYAYEEAESLRLAIDKIVKAREAMKGGGVYVDRMGRPYSVNDPGLEEIIKAERELEKENENVK